MWITIGGAFLSLLRFGVLCLLAWATSARAAGDAEEGRRVAERWCARCHVVGPGSLIGGIGSTPSFFLMHDKLDDYRERIRTFDERRPHKALEFDVGQADRDNLIAYIRVLERP
jgi:mono/diheme cytochrome c family protein